MEFNDCPWHDAELEAIYIDRRNAGVKDCVELIVCWPEDAETVAARSKIVFSSCYGFTANCNFGIIALETIRQADDLPEDPDLLRIRQEWKDFGVVLDNLTCYAIETNSTASMLKVYCTSISIEPLPPVKTI